MMIEANVLTTLFMKISINPKPVVRSAPSMLRNAREWSLSARGAQIFNMLPANLRSLNSDHIGIFKNHIDVLLANIPDQPTMTGLGRGSESNSLLQ